MKKAVFAARRGNTVIVAYTDEQTGEGLYRSVALEALDQKAADLAVEAINNGMAKEEPK